MAIAKELDDQGDVELKGKDFDDVCALLKSDDTVRGQVHKRPDGVAAGTAGRWSYCFSFSPDQYTEEELLDLIVVEYGPGIYPVQFKGKQKSGRPKIRWHKDMTVQARRLGAQSSTPASPSAPAANPTGLEAFASILDNQARILERISEAIAKPPPAVKTTIELVQELGAIKDLFTDGRQGALEQFRDAMELRKLIKDDEDNGGSDPLTVALKALTPAIERGVSALQEAEATPTRPQAASAPESLATQVEIDTANARKLSDDEIQENIAGVEASNETAIVYAYQLFAEKYLPALLQLAEAGQEPEEVASYLVRLIGDDAKTIDLVGLVIAQDDMVLRFSKVNSRVLQFTTWLDLVGDWIAHALWPATNPAPGPAGATQSATNDGAGGDGGINGPDAPGDQTGDAPAAGEQPCDAKPSTDAPGKGHDNDP